MLEKLTDEEIEFFETVNYPIAMAEMLFTDFDNMAVMEDEDLSHIRTYQYPLLSHEYLLDRDPKFKDRENFSRRKASGDCYALGGRLFGKTKILEQVDLLISIPLLGVEKCGFASYDAGHIKGVLEEIIICLENHPFLKLFVSQINRQPNYRFVFKNGYLLESVNMNISGKNPGANFYQKHFTRLYIEEASFETDQVFQKRRDSVSELGCVFRIAGMTNFTKYSPCGKVFYDPFKRKQIVNLPQKVNPHWGEDKRKEASRDFGGEQSINFRIFVDGEVVEEGESVFDMLRVRENYTEKRKVKVFEISKENFGMFESSIVVERAKNADKVYVCADIGESAPTEIVIIFQIGNKYHYVYNIILRNLTDKEQFKIFKFLAEKLKADFISVDCGDGTGRSIFRSLEEVFPKENLVWFRSTEKIPVDFEKDEDGVPIRKNGKFVYKEEFMHDWSIQNLKNILYSDRMNIPLDYKFDLQFNSVISMRSGTRTVYFCVCPENHLFQAFQVFSVCQWYTEFINVTPVTKKTFCKRGV